MPLLLAGPLLVACALAPLTVRQRARPPHACAPSGPQIVHFTGSGDLRIRDHGGLQAAAAADGAAVVPVFVLEPRHLTLPPSQLRRLHASLLSLERELSVPLIVRIGDASAALVAIAAECDACACHVIADDVEAGARASQRAAAAALAAAGVAVVGWDASLRPTEPWSREPARLPSTFPEYCTAIGRGRPAQPAAAAPVGCGMAYSAPIGSEGVPPLPRLLELAEAATPRAVLEARAACATTPPYDEAVAGWCAEGDARRALAEYALDGRDAFANTNLAAAGGGSLHAAAAQWLLDGGATPSAALALKEAAARTFSPALGLGALSARDVARAAAAAAADAGGAPPALESLESMSAGSYLGRSSAEALSDVVEEREWFALLARRTLALQEAGAPAGAPSDPRGAPSGDARDAGTFGYWRWGGEHLVRFESWPAGDAWDGEAPALLLVHGFAASCEQYERLVHALRAEAARSAAGAASLPPIYAMDLLGFGGAEKPGLSYTQHLWEAQVCDFAIEVMRGAPLVLAGNSIGGGIAAGAAANLRSICRGVVLLNTAGVLEAPDDYSPPAVSVGEATLRRALPKAYSPVPLVGQRGLDLFGHAVIGAIYPSIRTRLADIYSERPANADDALAFAIEQGASSPGSANVIGSGQKLPPQRPLNEVLGPTHGFGGPVLVAQGANDRVSGAERAVQRAADLRRLRDGVSVELIEAGGHCPQDDAPEPVAAALMRWLPQANAYTPP